MLLYFESKWQSEHYMTQGRRLVQTPLQKLNNELIEDVSDKNEKDNHKVCRPRNLESNLKSRSFFQQLNDWWNDFISFSLSCTNYHSQIVTISSHVFGLAEESNISKMSSPLFDTVKICVCPSIPLSYACLFTIFHHLNTFV